MKKVPTKTLGGEEALPVPGSRLEELRRELSEARVAAEGLTLRKLGGVISTSKEHPEVFQIHLDEATASGLGAGPITGDASLVCVRAKDGWIVSLIDAGQPKAYWTDLPDETNGMQADMIRSLLKERFQVGDIRPMRLMYDYVRDFRQTFFETGEGPMIDSAWRFDWFVVGTIVCVHG